MSAVFNNELELKLIKLDSDRLKAVFWLKMGIGIFILLSLFTVITGSDGLGISVVMTIVLSPIYILFNTHWGEYKVRYKEHLVPRLTASINGIFLKVDVNDFFENSVFVCPNARRLDRYFGLPEKINDEDLSECVRSECPDFAEEFNVYCNDKNVIRNLLPVAVMQRLVHMRRSLGSDIQLVFVDSNILITVSREKPYSEPKLFKPAISLEQASELHVVINDNIKLVTELIECFSSQGEATKS